MLALAFTELVHISSALTDAGSGSYTRFSGQDDPESQLSFTAVLPNTSWAAANITIDPYLEYFYALSPADEGL